MLGGLEGAVAVVSGGASGIGEACCNLLAASGATVHVADRAAAPPIDVTDRAALDRLASRLPRLLPIPASQSHENSLRIASDSPGLSRDRRSSSAQLPHGAARCHRRAGAD